RVGEELSGRFHNVVHQVLPTIGRILKQHRDARFAVLAVKIDDVTSDSVRSTRVRLLESFDRAVNLLMGPTCDNDVGAVLNACLCDGIANTGSSADN
ncbi:Short-chain dehydrogenase/reductase family Oxidoreductase, partial [Colletotrichum asianum]